MKRGIRLKAMMRNLFHREQVDSSLDAEVRGYVEMLTAEKIAAGIPAGEARRQALAECGGIEPVKQGVRNARAGVGLETIGQDVRYALRQMRRSPGFAALAVITLAVGIGANTAIFSFVQAVLLRPLPYPDSNRLQMILVSTGDATRAPASRFELFHLRLRTKEFDQVAGIWVTNGALPGEGDAEPVKVAAVTANFLPLLCPRPALGRYFETQDEDPNAMQSIVISNAVWVRRFGSDPGVIGRAVRFGKYRAVVIGVLPKDFRLLFPNDQSVPANVEAFFAEKIDGAEPQGPQFLHMVGRLRSGSTTARAQAEAESIARQINALDGHIADANFRLTVIPLQADDVREVRGTLLFLFAGVAFVLLIGCVNIANLLMARARQRVRETTIRAALGASRARLARQLLTESLLLAVIGAVAALALGWGAIRAILAFRPASFANFNNVSLDWSVLAFTFGIAVLTSVLFGFAPAMAVRRIQLVENLKETGSRAGWRRRNWSSALVAAEVALAFVLLLATGLLVRSFVNILRVDPGFRAENVFALRTFGANAARLREIQHNLAALPGVESASAISHLPLDDAGNWYDYYWKEGAAADAQNSVMADDRAILPGYFGAIGATMVAGRDFTGQDDPSHPHVVIVDDILARQLWPGESAIGKRINVSDSPQGPYQFQRDWAVVVGVVRHVRCHSLTAIVRPQIYVPFPLAPRPTMWFVIHSAGAAPDLPQAAREQIAKLDRYLPVSQAEPLGSVVDRAQSESRFASLLAILLSAVALLLACIGIYGVLSYSVAVRTSEIGIRMAIGAQRGTVMRMVLGDGFVPVALGLAVGFTLSLAVGPLIAGLLFGIKPADPVNYAVIAGVVAVVSILAALVPARRAMNVDPLTALRYE